MALRALWANPAYKAEQSAQQSARMVARWASPEGRAKLLPNALGNLKPAGGKPKRVRGIGDNRSARMKALWAIPEEAARMRAHLLKASQKALQARGGPAPKASGYIKVRNIVGAKAARAAFA